MRLHQVTAQCIGTSQVQIGEIIRITEPFQIQIVAQAFCVLSQQTELIGLAQGDQRRIRLEGSYIQGMHVTGKGVERTMCPK
jgi:hypothetical protein